MGRNRISRADIYYRMERLLGARERRCGSKPHHYSPLSPTYPQGRASLWITQAVENTDPRLVKNGGTVCMYQLQISPLKWIHFPYCPYYMPISVTLVTSIKIFGRKAGNRFFFLPNTVYGSKCGTALAFATLRSRYAR